ncbi:MAG TPA: hypothetical protein VM328_14010 [Fimbriimonadaceae bacterium]|nr:hypothetical protein [Fimbriimonadaceae bacterium]
MKLRLLSIVASAALCCAAAAQYVDTPENRVRDTFINLRGSSTLWLRIEGSETTGNSTTAVTTDVFWSNPLTSPPSLELLDYRGATLVNRTVGDSTVLWNYDPRRNQYSTARYGTYAGAAPVSATNNLLQSLAAVQPGPPSYAARLLREVYGGDSAYYRHWVTGNAPFVVENGQIYDDPITGRRFVSSANLDYAFFTQGNPVRRSVAFERWRDSNGIWRLSAVYVAEREDLRGRLRVLDLRMSVHPDQVPNTASFSFTPPAGSRAVALTRPGG